MNLFLINQGTGCQLPKNGEEWHAIRRGELQNIPQYSSEINDLLKVRKENFLKTWNNQEKRGEKTTCNRIFVRIEILKLLVFTMSVFYFHRVWFTLTPAVAPRPWL